MSELISSRDARARFAELLGRAEDHHEEFVITNHGRPVAVLVSAYQWESMRETLQLLSDPKAMADVSQGEKELAEGDFVVLHDGDTLTDLADADATPSQSR